MSNTSNVLKAELDGRNEEVAVVKVEAKRAQRSTMVALQNVGAERGQVALTLQEALTFAKNLEEQVTTLHNEISQSRTGTKVKVQEAMKRMQQELTKRTEQELKTLKKKLENETATSKSLLTDLKEKASEVGHLQQNLSMAKDKLDELTDAAVTAAREKEGLEAQIVQMTLDKSASEQNNQTLQMQLRETETLVDKSRAELVANEKKAKEALEEAKRNEKAANDANAEADTVGKQLAQLQTELDASRVTSEKAGTKEKEARKLAPDCSQSVASMY